MAKNKIMRGYKNMNNNTLKITIILTMLLITVLN